ncbi:MAG: ParB/Srx family N-terminal domain-containing protein [Planctomycetaceae bacterium]|nr:ParB/Srx family N-terminal domain-containing protein [Planctomycetaceae bacterium]
MNLSSNTFEHESTELPVSLLKPTPNNPRKRDKRSLREIAKSIKKFGFVQPIVTDKEYNIIIGHGRFAAAKHLGYKTVPVIIAKGLTEQQHKQLQISDNRLSELSSWNDRLLAEMLEEMNNTAPFEIPGYDAKDIEKILGISDYQQALRELPPLCAELPVYEEYHLLISCTREHYDRFVALRDSLKHETWCELEEASR